MFVVVTVLAQKDMRRPKMYNVADEREDIRTTERIIFFEWPAKSYDEIRDMLCNDDFISGIEMKYGIHSGTQKKVWVEKRPMVLQSMRITCVTGYMEGGNYAS